MALALYRKYRPKKLGDVLGQDTNVEILRNAARQNRIGHAYLFYGPRGTGKTTMARLIGKLLNCETRESDEKFRESGEPCNTCRACNAIDAQTSFDVIEIDAASNRGIEEIRNLKEGIRIAPAGGLYKIYIIDEAHMLTTPAFNALLKTLEEPPHHAVIILATTEYEKLPATIVSRTQRFLFKKLPKAKIMEKLATIAREEKIQIENAALELLAAAGEGSLRDAESVLEQLSTFERGIDLATAERLTGRAGFKKVHELAHLMLHNNLGKSLEYLSLLQEEGHNMVELTRELIHYLRKVVTLQTNPNLEPAFSSELTEDEVARMKTLLGISPTEKHIALLKSILRAYTEMRYSPFSFIPLEVALIETLSI